jgi:hypothetical protein
MPSNRFQNMIYCIGDSHISFFAGIDAIQPIWPKRSKDELPWFRTYHIGPALANNLSRDGTRSLGREKLMEVLAGEVPAAATVLLSFGEIDCRAHLVKQSQHRQRPLPEVVDACLDEYFRVVADLVGRGFRVVVYNAVASWPKVRTLRRNDKGGYATFGTRRQRLEAIRLFNAGARERCAACGSIFLSNEHHLIQGRTPLAWFFFDSIHLSQRAMPPTLVELARLLPDLRIEPPAWHPPTAGSRLIHWLRGRRQRGFKELGKLVR